MNRNIPRSWRVGLALAAVCTCWQAATTLAAPPPRVNRASLRTEQGHSAYDRQVVPTARSLEYSGGFFHFYPGRVMLREQQGPGEPIPAQFGHRENVPQPTAGHSVVVASNIEDVPDPVFGGAEPLPTEGSVLLDGIYYDDGGCQSCKSGKSGRLADLNWVCLCLPLPPDDNLSVNFGVHGFKDPMNFGLDNSFGFQEGFNLGFAIPCITHGLGWQVGLQGVHSNFSGAGTDYYGGVTDDRNQLFFTGGVFHRVDCGLQGGVVLDYMKDDWHYDVDVAQVRGELSYLRGDCYEFGFFFNAGVHDGTGYSWLLDNVPGVSPYFTVSGTDVYAAFFRHHFDDCDYSFARLYLGLTGNRNFIYGASQSGSPIFGADAHIGLGEKWAIESGFTFVASTDGGLEAAQQENWNIGINMIWYPHGLRANTNRRYYRPLFNVADNGSFLRHAGK